MTRWTRSLKKEKSEPTISGALFYLSNRSRIQVNVPPNEARETVTVLPFRPLPVTSASEHSGPGVALTPNVSVANDPSATLAAKLRCNAARKPPPSSRLYIVSVGERIWAQLEMHHHGRAEIVETKPFFRRGVETSTAKRKAMPARAVSRQN